MLAKPVSYPTGAFRQRVLEATLRELGAYGELTAAEVAFVKALDLPNLTLAALRDMPNIAPDGLPSPKRCLARAACSIPSSVCAGTMSFDDPNIQVGPSFNINSLQGYLDWEARQPCVGPTRPATALLRACRPWRGRPTRRAGLSRSSTSASSSTSTTSRRWRCSARSR
jgi:hypothetical protein